MWSGSDDMWSRPDIMWSTLVGPTKGVFPTPDTVPFFPSDTDIHLKTNVARHRHSDLAPRHLTLHISPTLTVSFPSRHRTLRNILCRRPTLRPPTMGPTGPYQIRIYLKNFFHVGCGPDQILCGLDQILCGPDQIRIYLKK